MLKNAGRITPEDVAHRWRQNARIFLKIRPRLSSSKNKIIHNTGHESLYQLIHFHLFYISPVLILTPMGVLPHSVCFRIINNVCTNLVEITLGVPEFSCNYTLIFLCMQMCVCVPSPTLNIDTSVNAAFTADKKCSQKLCLITDYIYIYIYTL